MTDTAVSVKPFPIPRIIHQTWKTAEVPDKWKKSPEEWQRLHPDWEYRLWTDADNRAYIAEKYPEFLATFDAMPYPIMRADAIRYFIMKDFGGIYADLDIVPIVNIESYFKDDAEVYLVNTPNMMSFFTNCFMASKPGAAFWDVCIEEMTKPPPSWAMTKHFHVLAVTGPIMVTRAVQRYNGTICRLPVVKFYPAGVDSNIGTKEAIQKCIADEAAVYNLPNGSWHSMDTKVVDFALKQRYLLITLFFIFIIALMVAVVYYRYIAFSKKR